MTLKVAVLKGERPCYSVNWGGKTRAGHCRQHGPTLEEFRSYPLNRMFFHQYNGIWEVAFLKFCGSYGEISDLGVDGVCQCCVELLSMNVAFSQFEPVIRSVLRNIASFEKGDLLKASTLSGMLAGMKY